MGKNVKLELTPEELKMVAYWRESCHIYNNYCPLHCLGDSGLGFCKSVTQKLGKAIDESIAET